MECSSLNPGFCFTLPTELRATPLALKTLKTLKVSTHKEEDRRNREVRGHVDTDWQTGSAENSGQCVSGSGVKVKWQNVLDSQFPPSSWPSSVKRVNSKAVDWRALRTAEDETIRQNLLYRPFPAHIPLAPWRLAACMYEDDKTVPQAANEKELKIQTTYNPSSSPHSDPTKK